MTAFTIAQGVRPHFYPAQDHPVRVVYSVGPGIAPHVVQEGSVAKHHPKITKRAETVHLLRDAYAICGAPDSDGLGSSIARETTCSKCASAPYFRQRLHREKTRDIFADVPMAAPARALWPVLLLLVMLSLPISAQTLTGPARVIDGDSLEIQGQKIRLHGVDAPELRQTCALRSGSRYGCGVYAAEALEDLIGNKTVKCTPKSKDRWGRTVARCFVGSDPHIDIGGWLVRNGLAVAYTKYSRDYVPQESVARGARVGIWAGPFVQPEQWRKGVREVQRGPGPGRLP